MVVIESGIVVEPYVHDAQIMGIILDKRERAVIPMEGADGRAMGLLLSGVVRLKADDFREGNTLLSISVSSGVTLDVRDVADAYDVSHADQRFLPKAMMRIASEGLIVVRISPSYGCSLVCICRDLDVIENFPSGLIAWPE